MQTQWTIDKISQHPDLIPASARWFHDKWGIPLEEYEASMRQCAAHPRAIPQWYVVRDSRQRTIAGAGVIDNDFHERKDCTPNLCALFVEEEYRGQGLARFLLDAIRRDMAQLGIPRLYLITEHEHFYEKCGWQFYTMVKEDSGALARMYMAETLI